MGNRTWATALLVTVAALAAGCGGGEVDAGQAEGGDAAAATAERTSGGGGDAGADSDSAGLLAERVMEWHGGRDAWEATRFLRFDWIVERDGETASRRSHAWDRWEGDYRLSYTGDDDTRVVALFSLPTLASDTVSPVGDVWEDGDRLEGAARDSALEQAYRAVVNDSYWLLMPLKWEDPGVDLEYAGREELPDGESYPSVHLTFEEGLGVTNDEYWGFVDPETGEMSAWRFHLEGDEQKGPVIWWRDWRAFGPQQLKLALDRRFEAGPVRIRFEEVAADTAVPDGVFTPPSE
ncbi:MAG: hypothetical protein ACOC83_04490 [Gemmatimonadota bacterium]